MVTFTRPTAASTWPTLPTRRDRRVVNDPSNALADADGNVRLPDLDLASQMSQLVMAQRGFQASVQTTKTAQDTYTAALQIGR